MHVVAVSTSYISLGFVNSSSSLVQVVLVQKAMHQFILKLGNLQGHALLAETILVQLHPSSPALVTLQGPVLPLHYKNKLVALTTEWLPWLQTS